MTTPVRIAITGAAGQIGYSLLFRIASGAMLGPDTPVILQLLEVTPALGALGGVKMELDDCAFSPLVDVICTDDANLAFGDADIAMLVGAMPRKDGMERSDLLSANGGIFKPQGQAISANAKKDVKVLVVGNPANTNSLIAMHNAPNIDPRQFTAMTRLDHNRAVSQLAQKVGRPVTSVKKMTIWGNHLLLSAVLRSLRHAVHLRLLLRPMLRLNTFVHGLKELQKATGSAWRFHRTAATAFQKV